MNENIVHEILDEVFSSLEALDTQSTAILQLLKDKGLATEQELAVHLEQAGNSSNVRWRAARVRIEHLISSALKNAEREAKREDAKPEPPKTEEKKKESAAETRTAAPHMGPDQKEHSDAKQDASPKKSEAAETETAAEKSENQPGKQKENEATGENEREHAA